MLLTIGELSLVIGLLKEELCLREEDWSNLVACLIPRADMIQDGSDD